MAWVMQTVVSVVPDGKMSWLYTLECGHTLYYPFSRPPGGTTRVGCRACTEAAESQPE